MTTLVEACEPIGVFKTDTGDVVALMAEDGHRMTLEEAQALLDFEEAFSNQVEALNACLQGEERPTVRTLIEVLKMFDGDLPVYIADGEAWENGDYGFELEQVLCGPDDDGTLHVVLVGTR